jgi:hypothetical protein
VTIRLIGVSEGTDQGLISGMGAKVCFGP